MRIGVPREIINNENRVALTPEGVVMMKQAGHEVKVETSAGIGSALTDEAYEKAGAEIVATAEEAWGQELVIKVKEPQKEEFKFLREDLLLFTYLHLAAEEEVKNALLEKKTTGIAYETIQLEDGTLPLLTPMSEIAGRMSVQIGVRYLEKINGGKGILAGGVPGVSPAKIVIIGGGGVGANAAHIGIGIGADVTLLDINVPRLRELENMYPGKLRTLASNSSNIAEAVKDADLLIGAVLLPGAKAPTLVTEEMVKSMEPGSVIVDVAVDQGGIVETIDRVTTHNEPTFNKHDVIHYAVANMPGAVPQTATYALTNVTAPYILQLANKGVKALTDEGSPLAKGLNTHKGKIMHPSI